MASVNQAASLLIVIGEPTADEHVGLILHRVIDGLSAWNHNARGFLDHDKPQLDLNTELRNFLNKNVAPENLEGGLILRSRDSANLHVDILVNPSVQTLQSVLSAFLTQPSNYKHLIHAGPAFAGNGSWILQDGTLSMHDFSRVLHRADATTALTELTPGSTLVVSCFPEGEWSDHGSKHHGLDKLAHVFLGQLNGNAGIDASCAADLQAYLQQYVIYTPLDALMPASNVVGSVRFRRPTLHIFPAGQGDAALFGVSGFTVLFDGGFNRKTCFWDFLRHVDRLDALLISRLSNSNAVGISSFVDRLATSECHPKLGYVFGNVPVYHKPAAASQEELRNPLLLSLHEEGAKIYERLAHLNLKPHPCAASISSATKHLEPLTLYQKVGQGRLDMYVLNPVKDSKELNEFTDSWKKGIHKYGPLKYSTKPGFAGADLSPPLSDQSSIAALLVWHPADSSEQIIRVLYPGSCPQEKILSGLEKLKHLDFLKHSTCTSASLEAKSTAPSAAIKKGPAAKVVDAVKSAVAAVSPKSPAVPKSPATPKAPAAAASPAAVAPKSAEAIVHEHHVVMPAAQPLYKGLDNLLDQPAEPLVDVMPPPLKEFSPPGPEDMLLEDFGPPQGQGEPPALQPEHVSPVHAHHDPIQNALGSPMVESENFIHREQVVAAAESDLLGMDRAHAGFSIAAEPMTASPFEAVPVGRTMEPSVLRLSTDQLHEYYGDHGRADIEEPSPVSPNEGMKGDQFHQQAAGHLLDSPPEGQPKFDDREFRAPAEPILHEHPQTLPVHGLEERSVQEKFSHESPEGPLLVTEHGASSPQPPHSPRTQQRINSALNPEAPAFVPKFGDASPTAEQGFAGQHPLHQHHEHTTSPMDPFSEKGFGDAPRGFDSFRNGSTNLLEDTAWPTEAAAAPKRAADLGTNPFGDDPFGTEASPEERRKKVDEAVKDWGEPLGLPAPPVATTKGPQHGAAAGAKPKANGPASAANESKASKPATSTATTTMKRTTTTTTTSKTSTGAAAKPGASADAKPASSPASAAAAKKSPAAASTAPKTAAAAGKSAAAPKPTAVVEKKAPLAARPATSTVPKPSSATATAPKPSSATAAAAKSSTAAKKPGPPGISYYVDLTYVPHNGNPHYCNAEFFKHIRSKHYVLSSLHPSKEILEALLVGKKAWNLPEEEVTLIPTYDSDTLNMWMALHKDDLASESIDVAPSCCRCTVNLEEHQGAKCAAYRLEL